jgi:ABC-type glycerol-3-phosphate transport system substrate-binding protein
MKLIRTMAALAGVAAVLTACGGSGSDAAKTLGITDPEIHFIHAIPGGPAVDFLVNGKAPGGQTNINYLGVTNFTNINTGNTNVAYADTGTTTALACGNFPDAANGHEYTVGSRRPVSA